MRKTFCSLVVMCICLGCAAQDTGHASYTGYYAGTDSVVIDIDRSLFHTDTFTTREGHAYTFYHKRDSVALLLANISLAELPCCSGGKYQELTATRRKGAIDHRGIETPTGRRWRELESGDLNIIYYHACDLYAAYYDRLFDSISLRLGITTARKKATPKK
ncbi:MAG: hypothetical protein JST90_08185 [Bacteroidetes bacterium]|nr:hypothetical protein [Bacteroidota bacterium]